MGDKGGVEQKTKKRRLAASVTSDEESKLWNVFVFVAVRH